MEDDDEFGDLYTDVLRPLQTASFQFQQPPASQNREDEASAAPTAAATSSFRSRPIDLNINSDDEEILYGAPNSDSRPNLTGKTLDEQSGSKVTESNLNLNEEARVIEGSSGIKIDINQSDAKAGPGVLDKCENVSFPKRGFEESDFMNEGDIDVVVEEREDIDDDLVERDQNMVENLTAPSGNLENFETEAAAGEEPLIPGVSIPGVSDGTGNGGDGNFENEWDSDSEDDLQIVLNDNNHGLMGMGGEEDDDEDGEPLVIVADNDGPNHQLMMEEQEGGEEGADGERKETGDALKVNGAALKVGYNSHPFHHPFHSQYKYVRPGAPPIPGAPPVGPGGIHGQVRPPVNANPMAGRGRGDWRPTGQKGFHPGNVMSGWGGNGSGRGLGIGLDFTLPSYKTIFEVDIDGFEEKPWRLPGIDVTDFFNFDLNEEGWKDYCKQLEQLRPGSSMQGRIRVYESGRTEQEYDPDLPPELAAAAAGIQDIPSENVNIGKTDGSATDLARGSARMRPPLPTGRPIQVEIGSGDRLPSIDTRPPRQRDSDAIIEIVCQDSADDDHYTGSDKNVEQLGSNPSREDFKGDASENPQKEALRDFDDFQHSYNSRKRAPVGRRKEFMNPVHGNLTKADGAVPSSEAAGLCISESGGQTSASPSRNYVVQHDDRGKIGRTHYRSPDMTPSGSSRDRPLTDNQKEESFGSVDDRHSPLPSSPTTDKPAQEQGIEHKDDIDDEFVREDRNNEVESEEMALDARTDSETMRNEDPHSVKKQKISPQLDQPSPQETDGVEVSKVARISENSRVRSESSKAYHKLRDGVAEVVQDGRSIRMDNSKKAVGGDEDRVRKKARDEKETEKHHMAVKGRGDSHSHKGVDSAAAHHIDRRREREYSEGAWQRRDEDLDGRRTKVEELRKKDLIDDIGSRHRNKMREFDGSEREERHLLKKQLENGSMRPDYDKDMGSRHRDRDELKRYDNIDDRHSKRRKEDARLSREHAEKEETFHSHGESMVRRKRERDDAFDQRRKDELSRLRDDDQQYIRHKEVGLFQRERSDGLREREWYRIKQSHEEVLSKRERDEARGIIRAGRAAEEKAWDSRPRGRDEYKSSDHPIKDMRHNEHVRRRDRAENGSPSRLRAAEDVRGHQLSNGERKARHERVSPREDRAPYATDISRVNEKKYRENFRKGKESEGADHNSLRPSNMKKELSGQTNEALSTRGKFEEESNENQIHVNRQSTKKHWEEALSDDEQQDSRRGRSKLERWTSHKERDLNVNAKSSSTLTMKHVDAHRSSGTSFPSRLPEEVSKMVEDNQRPPSNDKSTGGPEICNVEAKHTEDKHLETVEKLKKRSERFKLPMPSEKETTVSKKVEGEPLPVAQSEAHPDSEVKPERPARRRRWTGN